MIGHGTLIIKKSACPTVSDENLQKVQKLAEEMDWSIHVYLHEGASECNDSENGTPCRPLQVIYTL